MMNITNILNLAAVEPVGTKLFQDLKNITDQTRRWLIFSLSLIMFLGGVYGCSNDAASEELTILKSGEFTDVGARTVAGDGSIGRDSDDKLWVKLGANFRSQEGMTLKVYITQGFQEATNITTNFLDLGLLSNLTGEQRYPIPSGTSIALYDHIVIYCFAAKVAFGKAILSIP